MDTNSQWPEGIGVVQPMEGGSSGPVTDQRKPRPQKPQALNCPRCNSTHTKFCYYNNYSLSQPRYFCKTCRRYWTEGGSLRNVPVGGGSRKNKRSTLSSSSISKIKLNPDQHLTSPSFSTTPQNPKIHDGQDLNLAYPAATNISEFVGIPYTSDNKSYLPNTTTTNSSSTTSYIELLKSGIASRGFSSFMTLPLSDSNNVVYSSSGLPFQDFKPSLNFGFESSGGYGGVEESGHARLFFPSNFEELKQPIIVTSSTELELQNKGQGDQSTGYWINGGLSGSGTSW